MKKKQDHRPAERNNPKQVILKSNNGGKTLLFLRAIIILFTLLIYFNTIQNGYVLDDKAAITQNNLVKSGISAVPDLLKTSYWYGLSGYNDDAAYRPVSLIMFAIEWQFFPNNAHVSHFINVLIYCVIGLLLFEVLLLFPSIPLAVKITAVLLFLAHPVHTEVVANIKSRDELMGLFLALASLFFALKYSITEHIRHLILTVVFFLLGLFSKENVIVFAGLIPLTIFFFSKASVKAQTLVLISLLSTVAIYLFIRFQILGTLTPNHQMMVMDNALMSTDSRITQLATAIYLLLFYIIKLIVPYPLAYDYSYNQIELKSPSDPVFIISCVAFLGLIIFSVRTFKSKSIYAFSILWFFISISIVSNIPFYIGSTFAERFLFAPSFAFSLPFAVFFYNYFAKKAGNQTSATFGELLSMHKNYFLIIGCMLSIYSVLTINRNPDWKDELSLFGSGAKVNSKSSRTHCNYGAALFEEAKQSKDVATKSELLKMSNDELKKSIEIFNSNAEAHRNYGSLLLYVNDTGNALKHFEDAEKFEPGKSENLQNIGYIYGQQKQFDKAVFYLGKSLRLNQGSYVAWNNLGRFYGQSGRFDSAEVCLKKSIALNPEYFNNYLDLGTVYAQQNLLEPAVQNYEKAFSIDQSATYILVNAGNLFAMNKNYPRAIEYYKRVLNYNPNDKMILSMMAYTYSQMGDKTNADLFQAKVKNMR